MTHNAKLSLKIRATVIMLGLFNLSRFTAGFIAVVVGYSSSAVIIFQAAGAAGASEAEISSWMWAIGIGMGLSSIGLSLWYRMPILTAWSTPGAALLVTSLPGLMMSDAIGVFIFSSSLILLFGITGWFKQLMRVIPTNLASAMLAGVLLQFGLNLFIAMQSQWLLVILMLASYFVCRRYSPRLSILLTLCVGIAMSGGLGLLNLAAMEVRLAAPVLTWPSWNVSALVGIGIPLFVVTMASQNIPGITVLQAYQYRPPSSPLISWTGFTGILLAPFGGFAFNLAAITAAICMGKEADPDPSKRYFASVWAGILYLVAGLFGATVVAVFTVFPAELIAAIAGLALLATTANSLAASFEPAQGREAALITLLITASGFSLLGVSSAFWGLLLGLLAYHAIPVLKPVDEDK
ncbi:Inner membrane protein YdcO [Sinobacterium norvegicum]|uniref:Inner membrane protein YdcO n=1 Tax=Sinobacterium norvegicum TaxID=1641715 RepID=A0ABM9AGS1_9GAMM|nr:benzoate/H(+) symporter BenE family transporter [Sinobacterium norvegicum]CAH0992344.1 Inner membrane protein YdcO [Sinobacterium norvegicum]